MTLGRIEELLLAGRLDEALAAVRAARASESQTESRVTAVVTRALGEAGLEPTVVLEEFARSVAQALEAACVVTLATPDRARLELVTAHHPRPEARDLILRAFEGVTTPADMPTAWAVFERGEPVFLPVAPPGFAPRFRQYAEAFGISSVILVPLRTRQETLGTVGVTRDAGAAPFEPEDLEALQTLADRAALAYENALLHRELATQRALLERVLRHVPHGIVVVEAPSGRALFANPAAEELLGHRYGMPEQCLVHPDGRSFDASEYPLPRVVATGEPVSGQFLCRRGDGELRTLQLDAGPVRGPAGVMVAAVASFVDITDLREESRRKDEFVAMLAHELRNPLAPIRIALQVLRSGCGDAAAMHDAIDRQVVHLTRLVDDLLDVSRITRGKIRLELGPIDAGVIARRAIETVQSLVESRRQRLVARLPDEPAPLLGDETRLTQVLGNLLHNASKFSPDEARIELSAELDGDDVVFRIADEGIGLLPDELERIFEPFVQVDTSLARSTGGLGIGLTLARRLVNLHGGRLRALSDGPGRGSTFVVRLPRGLAPVRAPARAPALAEESPRRRVLLVDDNEDVAMTFAALLGSWGHEVRTERDGAAALAALAEQRPDVVFLDIGLPGMDGFEVARRMRAGGQRGRIIAVTGYGREQDRRAAREAGFDDLIVKPPELASVLQALEGA